MTRLQDNLQEREELLRRYRREKRIVLDKLCASSSNGEKLKRFIATLNHFNIEHANRMVEYVESESRKWLASASVDIRYAALEAIGNRVMTVRLHNGMAVIDDPLPDEPESVFFRCKKAIGL
jgi:hypothetical protein